ncbi:MAG: YceI family protein [Acidobacteriota bacterium]|nr:YceI family protein [Acidobacteriota bacterium]
MRSTHIALGLATLATLASFTPRVTAQAPAPLGVASSTVTVTGTTNVHGYTATTTAVRVKSAKTGAFDGDLWRLVEKPALVEAFEITIPAASLHSTKDGVDKNMHKAMKVTEFKDITFRVKSLEARGAAGALRALGSLTIAGVTKDITLDLTAKRAGANLSLSGELPLLMNDYGITPPKAMMGMMRTDPKIVIRVDLVLAPRAS